MNRDMETRTIHKYHLPFGDAIEVQMPAGAEILAFAPQGDEPGNLFLWALVNPINPWEIRRFVLRGTGHPIDDGSVSKATHVGTVQDGPFVWHLFERHGYVVEALAGAASSEKGD